MAAIDVGHALLHIGEVRLEEEVDQKVADYDVIAATKAKEYALATSFDTRLTKVPTSVSLRQRVPRLLWQQSTLVPGRQSLWERRLSSCG